MSLGSSLYLSSSWAQCIRETILRVGVEDDGVPLINDNDLTSDIRSSSCCESIRELIPDFRPQWQLPSCSITDEPQTYHRQSLHDPYPPPPPYAYPSALRLVRDPHAYGEYTSLPPRSMRRISPMPPNFSRPCRQHDCSANPRPPTHRSETLTNYDPPPAYEQFEPSQDAGRQDRPIGRAKATTAKACRSVVRCVEDMPRVMKDVQQWNRVRRARTKILWLENHNFVSTQERLLRRDISG
jgi:hypothetical protein